MMPVPQTEGAVKKASLAFPIGEGGPRSGG